MINFFYPITKNQPMRYNKSSLRADFARRHKNIKLFQKQNQK